MVITMFSRFFKKKHTTEDSKAKLKEERNKEWDQKIARHQELARSEEREIEKAERKEQRNRKISKLKKTGKKAAKGFANDMWHATKIAAKGLGDWADRVAPDETPAKRRKAPKTKPKTKTKARTKTLKGAIKTKTVTKRALKTTARKKPVSLTGNKRGIPEFATINGKRYKRAGTFGDDLKQAQNYATQLRSHGLEARVKKITVGKIAIWSVWYKSKTTLKKCKRTKNSMC